MASIVKRGRNYSVVYDIGKDKNGKRQQKWASGFNYKEAVKRRTEIDYLKSRNKGYGPSHAPVTLSEFYDIWLPVYQTNWQFKTYQMATDLLCSHVLPYIAAYVGGNRHLGAGELDSFGGGNRHLRRENWTLT